MRYKTEQLYCAHSMTYDAPLFIFESHRGNDERKQAPNSSACDVLLFIFDGRVSYSAGFERAGSDICYSVLHRNIYFAKYDCDKYLEISSANFAINVRDRN